MLPRIEGGSYKVGQSGFICKECRKLRGDHKGVYKMMEDINMRDSKTFFKSRTEKSRTSGQCVKEGKEKCKGNLKD